MSNLQSEIQRLREAGQAGIEIAEELHDMGPWTPIEVREALRGEGYIATIDGKNFHISQVPVDDSVAVRINPKTLPRITTWKEKK